MLSLDLAPVRHLSQEIQLQQEGTEAAVPTLVDLDGIEARLVDLARDRNFSRARHGRGPGYRKGLTRAELVTTLDAFRTHLDGFRLDADADLAAALQQSSSAPCAATRS